MYLRRLLRHVFRIYELQLHFSHDIAKNATTKAKVLQFLNIDNVEFRTIENTCNIEMDAFLIMFMIFR